MCIRDSSDPHQSKETPEPIEPKDVDVVSTDTPLDTPAPNSDEKPSISDALLKPDENEDVSDHQQKKSEPDLDYAESRIEPQIPLPISTSNSEPDNAPTKTKSDYSFTCLLYTSPSPRDGLLSRMPSSA